MGRDGSALDGRHQEGLAEAIRHVGRVLERIDHGIEGMTDEKRSLRLYGSEVVLARLTRDAGHVRLHLLNYGGRPIDGLRVRLLGSWVPGDALAFGQGRRPVEEVVTRDGATEFSLGTLGPYAVIDLRAAN
jgi:hypothetical protein